MRFVAVDWGTTRCRAVLVANGRAEARAESEDGISRLRPGQHQAVFQGLCGAWLAHEPDLPVLLVGMVGSREGWAPAPYVACPCGPSDIATALLPVDIGNGHRAFVVPGAKNGHSEPPDVMRGEETHLLGAGVQDGLVALPGTHCKWAEMRNGRLVRFSTFPTGELHGLLREHSMIGRPAEEPADDAGFAMGLNAVAADRGGLLRAIFGARAATLTGSLSAQALGPYLSGLLTGAEIAGALAIYGTPSGVTVVADPSRAELYVQALTKLGIAARTVGQEETLISGIARILSAAPGALASTAWKT